MSEQTTLVIGGSGKTGRRVAERLKARQLPVRIASRSSQFHFDWTDDSNWDDAIRGIHAAYITYFPDLAAPGAADTIQAFTDLAATSGVRKLVLLSGRGEAEAQRSEQIVQASGVDWTVVRASWFAQNFSESYLLDPILGGEVALPAGNVGEPFVDADDIADVVVAALTEARHAGQLYEVSGPRSWTFEAAVAEIARATGRRISYTKVPLETYAAEALAAQVPADVVSLLTYLFGEVLDGRNSSVCDGVERALNRPARDFSGYVRDTARTGIWTPGR